MNCKELQARKEYLENINRQLLEELYSLNSLLQEAGFPLGLLTVKEMALQMISPDEEYSEE